MSYHGGPGYGYPQAPQPNLPTPMPNMPTPMPNMPPPQPTITSQPESESSPPSSHMGNGQPPMGQPMPMGDVPPGMCPQCRVRKNFSYLFTYLFFTYHTNIKIFRLVN